MNVLVSSAPLVSVQKTRPTIEIPDEFLVQKMPYSEISYNDAGAESDIDIEAS